MPRPPRRQPAQIAGRLRSGTGPRRAGRVTLFVRDWGAGLRTTNARALIRLALSSESGRPTTGLVTVERVARLHGGAWLSRVPPGAAPKFSDVAGRLEAYEASAGAAIARSSQILTWATGSTATSSVRAKSACVIEA